MTRILFLGDSAGTGFGSVTRDLGSALIALGEDVRFLSFNEQPTGNLPEPFAGRTAVLDNPNGWQVTGEVDTDAEVVAHTLARMEGMFTGALFDDGWTPEAGIILGDVASVMMSPVPEFVPDGFPVFHYVPIEGVGLSPSWAAVWRNLRPVAMSRFGAEEIAHIWREKPPVVYHGVNGDDFWPVSATRPIYLPTEDGGVKKLHTKADCKRAFGWDPNRITLLRTDRNVRRKMYPALFRALAPVLARHPNVDFSWHCHTIDQEGNLMDEVSKYGRLIRQFKPTLLHDQYDGVNRRVLNALYNAADIYVSNSSEGFGLCIAEALACGVPAVGQNFSAVPEVIGPAGITVPILTLIDNGYAHFWGWADEGKFGAAVESLVNDAVLRTVLGAKGPGHVRDNFSWPQAAIAFRDLIAAAVPQEVAA